MAPLVAHLVPNFPALSESAILNELYFLKRLGAPQIIIGFRPPPLSSNASEVAEIMPTAVYLDRGGDAGRGRPGLKRTLLGVGRSARHWLRGGLMSPREMIARAPHARDAARLSQLAQILQEQRPRILHAHFAHDGVFCLPAVLRLNLPLIVSCRGKDISLLARHDRRVREQFYVHTACFLVRSQAMARDLVALRCPADRITVHHSGVNVEKLRPPQKSKTQPARDPAALMVGRLVEKKGFDTGLRAIALCRRRIRIHIIGVGPEEGRLKALAHTLGVWERVSWLGAQPHQAVISAMRSSSFLLQPSHAARDGDREGIPVVLMEAMALGLPVIASNHGGIAELITDGVNGFLAPEKDAVAMADAIDSLLANPDQRAELTQAARKTIVAEFNAESQARKLLEIYRKL